ncbi:MAG: hypothetical protein M1819_004800 [Sarea resinae]|nr:MAG: hypothetical protein M1819_004800 [Sarea resinae]
MGGPGACPSQFPDLSSSITPARRPPASCMWRCDQPQIPVEILIISWASLLNAYTDDEKPIFRVGSEYVEVDLPNKHFSPKEATEPASEGDRSTGISFSGDLSDLPDLALHLYCPSEGGSGRLSTSGIIPSGHLEEIARQLEWIVRQTLRDRIDLVREVIDDRLALSVLNPRPQLLEGPKLLHQLLGKHSRTKACAIDFLESDGARRRFSYESLDILSTSLAFRLKNTILGTGHAPDGSQIVVPILIPQSPELYIAILAVLKAGAAFCPLNLDAPTERVKFIIEDIAAKAVLTTSEYKFRFSNDGFPPTVLVSEEADLMPTKADALADAVDENKLAYVMYTSGSTGTPKGVSVSHSAATQALLAHDAHIPHFNRFLQFAAPTFDVSVFEIFFPLFRGSTLVGCDRSNLLSDLPEVMRRLEVDAAELTPTVAGGLLRSRQNVPLLKVLLTIGEQLTRSVVDEFGGSSYQIPILHGMYGPTEAAIHCTLATHLPANSKVGIIGVPLETVSALIVSPHAGTATISEVEVLPAGYIGELAIGGHQLANEYLNRPEQTAQAFIETKQYGRVYRTGDKARLLPDGSLEFLGRISSGQVKLRGQRIELGEAEQAACRTPGINTAIGRVINGTLVMFCVTGTPSITQKQILEVCRKWLPGFMVPGDVVLLEEAPRLSSGKVDAKKLEADYKIQREQGSNDEEPLLDETEHAISNVAQKLLGSKISRSSSLAAAGLDSLRAIQFASELRGQGMDLGTVDILNADTIERIRYLYKGDKEDKEEHTDCNGQTSDSGIASTSLRTDALKTIEDIYHLQIEDVCPCTPIQASLLAETAINPQAYCNWVELEVLSPVNFKTLQCAFKQLAKQNAILRTGFVAVQGSANSYAQVIWKDLSDHRFCETSKFSYRFELNEHSLLFSPLRVQLHTFDTRSRLLIQIHHALYDGWSLEHILTDLECLLRGKDIIARPQYRCVVDYFSNLADSDEIKVARVYWRQHLEGVSPSQLPNFHGRLMPIASIEALRRNMTTPLQKLELAARGNGVSPQTFFQAAFAYLLSCYLGSPDIVFGSISSGRTFPVRGIEDIIGPCITTVPTRIDISKFNSTKELLKYVHSLNRKALNQYPIPFRDIKKDFGLSPRRSLFDTLIVWQQTLRSGTEGSSLIRQIDAADFLEFNLTLEIEPGVDSIAVKANYQKSLLPEAQVDLLLQQIDQLVCGFLEDTDLPIQDFGRCFCPELLSIENPEPQFSTSNIDLYNFVEDAASETPDRLAIEFAESIDGPNAVFSSISYSNLNRRSNLLAHHLIEKGASCDELVCICMEKSIDLYVTILAVIKTGAAYLPITPETPRERISQIITQAQVKLCVGHSASRPVLENLATVSIITVDEEDFCPYPETNPAIRGEPSDLAYAVFTSGSTGIPKGVMVTRQNLLSNLDALAEIYPVTSSSKLLQSCSQAFDVSVFEIFFSWKSRICLCSATKDVLFRDIENAIRTMGITHLSLTPTVAALVTPAHVPTVKFLVTAGEGVTEKVFNDWADKGLYNGYGPSETTNICSVRPRTTASDFRNNVGPPFKNTSTFVAYDDDDFSLMPRGAVGEFCFGGDQVFRGYMNMPELNYAKILDHPKFGRLYRSGDYGRLLPDGSLSIVGRKDDQIKIRGQRIELGEINNNLLRSPNVHDCISLAVDRLQTKTTQLVSFWVPKGLSNAEYEVLAPEGTVADWMNDLWDELTLSLPAYMLPSALIPVSRLPETVQSKVDKKKLASTFESLSSDYMDLVSQHRTTDSEEQWTETEHQIADAVAKTTGIPVAEIHRQTSFFGLGLDSISAISLSRNLRESDLAQVDVSAILRYPSVASLCREITQRGNQAGTKLQHSSDLQRVFDEGFIMQTKKDFERNGQEVKAIYPCTPLQDAMLSAADSVENPRYYNHTILKIHGEVQRLQNSWTTMSQRHDILRTCFVTTDDSRYAFAQVVLYQCDLPWATVNVPSGNLEIAVRDQMNGTAKKVEESRPPYALTAFVGPSEIVLLISMHHALYDGGAISVLYSEIEESYFGAPLPPVVPFDGFLAFMDNLQIEEADKFWGSSLEGFEPNSFPDISGESATVKKMLTGTSIGKRITKSSLSALENECKRLSISLLGLGQAAWAKLLSTYLGNTDVCFGNVVSGRTIPMDGVERIVGPCFNTLPVRVKVAQATNLQLIRDLQRINSDSLPFQLTPLRRIQQKFSQDGLRLFDTLFILQQPETQLNEDIWSLKEDIGEMDLPIVLELVPNRDLDSLTIFLHGHSSIVKSLDVDIILESFESTMSLIFQFPLSPAGNFDHIGNHLLSTSNEDFEVLECQNGSLVHLAFEKNARSKPEAVALCFMTKEGTQTIFTFQEMNQLSNRIAHALVRQGVQPDDPVPIFMSKGPDFYLSVLAVLKAGAAFTPIDTTAPIDRNTFILEELRPRFILCNSEMDMSWSGLPSFNVDDLTTLCDLPIVDLSIKGLSSANLSYRLYTSGSTGRPKAVNVEHRNATQTIECSRSILPWEKDTRLLQFAATTFDMCYYDCFLAWTFGFALCATTQPAMINDLISTINDLNITMLDLTPTVAMTLAKESVPSIECLYCIGEAMPQQLADRWGSKCLNSYGPTEAAMCCTIRPSGSQKKSTIIGSPFPTTTFTVKTSDQGSAVPIFGLGELYIGGPQVARGYYANEALTRSHFLETRFPKRVYKSGDLVRKLSDGNYDFIGRSDDQIKIRGLRVELDEISIAVKGGDPRIRDVTTQVLKYSPSSKEQIVSFLVITPANEIDQSPEIERNARTAASARLPAYMVPKTFIIIDRIPLSSAGKVDKLTLRKLYEIEQGEELARQNDQDADGGGQGSWTQEETELRRILSNLSGITADAFGRDTTIYQLGLDSISAVQIAAQLRKKDMRVTAADILKRPTIGQLTRLLLPDRKVSDSTQTEFDFRAFHNKHCQSICQSLSLPAENIEFVRPCTAVQAGMIAQFLHSNGKQYFNHVVMRISPSTDMRKLHQAWKEATKKHEMLRTGFALINDEQYPFAMLTYLKDRVETPWTESVEHADISPIIQEERNRAANYVQRNLHLPSWRLTAIRTGSTSHLQFSAHHALYDAHSLQLILDDVVGFYSGDKILPAIQPNYLISTILSAQDREDDERAFWDAQNDHIFVNRFPNLTPLRVDTKANHVASMVCSATRSDLEDRCKTAGITMQAAGQAAWARLLAAYTGEHSVTFGSVLSGRTICEDAESVAFPCIATLPLACNVQGSNLEFAQQIMSVNSALVRHQSTPLPKIQRWTGHSDQALFDTIFAFQKSINASPRKLPWQVIDEGATVDFSVSIELQPVGDTHFEFRITFADDLIPKEQAQMILRQLDALIWDTVNSLSAQSTDMSKLNTKLLSITPPKERMLASDVKLLHQFVEWQARCSPEKLAFEFASSLHGPKLVRQQWTYHQLDADGNKIAHLLQTKGAKPGDLVAICFEKCPEASLAILGILKAGCAYVALDPGAPIARKSFIIEDSEPSIILSAGEKASELQDHVRIPVINLEDKKTIEKMPSESITLPRAISPSDTCYCLYTSGTTGTPKGCEITHENAVQAMLSFQRLFKGHWDEESKWLQFASFHFDVSVLEQYWSWSVGICVSSAPRDLIFEDLAGTIQQLGITHIDLTPSLARLLHPDEVPSLCRGVFITGGEQLRQDILDVWGSKGVIYNGYGPTEATIGVTMFPRVPANGKPSNIGPQFDNVGSFVFLPNSSTPVLRGAVGELCVSGPLVGRGYLNRPALTRERFPLIEPSERVYRTGDLVRILHDGTFDFLGRADDQVKLRGQRLEIGEINAVIKKGVEDVHEVTSLVLKLPKQQKEQLVSFVVPKNAWLKSKASTILIGPETADFTSAIRKACQASLPGYMVPTHFVPVNFIPLSANNKVDAKQLKELYSTLSVRDLQKLSKSEDAEEDFSDEERRIFDILAQLVHIDPRHISRYSSIFELGLDSISVIAFSKKLRDAGFGDAQTSLVMQKSTIDQLAKALASSEGRTAHGSSIRAIKQQLAAFSHKYGSSVSRSLHVSHNDIEEIAPCTPLQEGIISRTLESTKPLYFAAFYFELLPTTEVRELQRAWISVMKAAQILRTLFVPTTDGYIQVTLHHLELPWTESTASEELEVKRLAKTLHRKWWQQNRDIIRKPFEILIIRAPTRTVMCLHIFHALYDGNSLPVMLHRVLLEYHKAPNIEYGPSYLQVLPYGPLKPMDDAKSFWTRHLNGSGNHKMPILVASPSKDSSEVSMAINDPGAFEAVRRKLKVTHQAVAQACWMSVLQKYIPDLTIGIVVSGRSIDIEHADLTIGPLFNTIPFHPKVNAISTWTEAVQLCHNFNTEALPFQHTPLRNIMKWCRRTPDRPLFDTLFVFQKEMEEAPIEKGPLWRSIESTSEADYPLSFEAVYQLDGSLRLTIVSQGSVSNKETSTQLLQYFKDALSRLQAHPEQRISEDARTELDSVNTVNGVSEAGLFAHSNTPINEFQWTKDAFAIRNEIASLASADPATLTEDSSIFELGLDSIDAIKLSSRLKQSGINISVSEIMRTLTVANMTAQVAVKHNVVHENIKEVDLDDYEQRLKTTLIQLDDFQEIQEVLPVTPLQEAMVAEMIQSDFKRYFNHDVLKILPSVDTKKLEAALNAVVKDSPILRTSFFEIDEPSIAVTYAQLVHSPKTVAISTHTVDGGNNFRALFDTITEDVKENFSSMAPFRLTFAEVADEKFLILSISHALYDGWSLSLFHDDVRKAYDGLYSSRPSWRGTLENILNSSGNDAASFWSSSLAGVKPSAFPRNSCVENEESQTYRKERTSLINLDKVSSFCRSQRVSMQALGQTCWSLVLARHLHQLDVVFGAVLSGRESEESNLLLFPTMNTVAIRSVIHGSRKEMLHYVQENISNISQYQHFPLRKAQAMMKARDGKLFDTLFIYQKQPNGSNGTLIYESVGGLSDVEYPVCAEMEATNESLIWRVACDSSTMDAENTELLLHEMDYVLRKIIESPESPVLDISEQQISICGLAAFRDEEETPLGTESSSPDIERQAGPKTWSATEKKIRKVLSTVGMVPEDQISKHSSLFHLGLDSISAIKVSALLKKQSMRLSVSDMLKAATVENMARIISNRQIDVSSAAAVDTHKVLADTLDGLDTWSIIETVGIKRVHAESVMPATAGQVYMLSSWQNSEGTLFYPTFDYRVIGDLEPESLEKAWTKLVQNLPILRTTFIATKDERVPMIQVALRSSNEHIVWVSENHDEETKRNKKSDLAAPPVTLYAQQRNHHIRIKLQIHHALYDGVSLPRMIHQLQRLCNNIDDALRMDSIADFVAFNCTHSSKAKQEQFWKNYLGATAKRLPFRQDVSYTTRTEVFQPNVIDTGDRLERKAKQEGVSMQALIIAACAVAHGQMLQRATGSEPEDVIFGIYLANRSHGAEGLDVLLAPTVNLVPMRVHRPFQRTFMDIAISIQEDLQEIGSIEHSNVSLWDIESWTGIKVDCFINILTLPDSRDESEHEAVKIEEVEQDWKDGHRTTIPGNQEGWQVPVALRGNLVNKAYVPSVDIEAAVKNGQLGLGVFGPTSLIDFLEADCLIGEVRKALTAMMDR